MSLKEALHRFSLCLFSLYQNVLLLFGLTRVSLSIHVLWGLCELKQKGDNGSWRWRCKEWRYVWIDSLKSALYVVCCLQFFCSNGVQCWIQRYTLFSCFNVQKEYQQRILCFLPVLELSLTFCITLCSSYRCFQSLREPWIPQHSSKN